MEQYRKQCEAQVAALAEYRPILCPIFETMAEHMPEHWQSMSVPDFVDMCLDLAPDD